jgi:hypothetical protein
MDKPLLLIDIDGVISLFGFDHNRPPAGKFEIVDGIAHFLSASAGQHLRELAHDFELVWCSGWEEKANEYLPLALGLPAALPHLTFGREIVGGVTVGGESVCGGTVGREPRPETPRAQTHWKLAAIDSYAGASRPLAWIDDTHDDASHQWAARRPGRTLLICTDPAVGLTPGQVRELLAWVRAV